MPTDPDLPVRQPSLADQVCDIILKWIADGSYSAGSPLPSENQLAERYNVSRSTIRAAFARLVEQGVVKRKRGVGTFVAESTAVVDSKYQQFDVYDRIAAQGLEPGVLQQKSEMVEVGGRIAEKLVVEMGSPALLVDKVFTANGKPAIWFRGYLPERIFEARLSLEQVLEPKLTESFYKFFPGYCQTSVKYQTTTIHPEIAENCHLPDPFVQLAPHTPILVIESIGYDEHHTPLFFSLEYLVGGERAFHVLRYADGHI